MLSQDDQNGDGKIAWSPFLCDSDNNHVNFFIIMGRTHTCWHIRVLYLIFLCMAKESKE